MPTLDKTFVYDLDEKAWYEWTSYYSAAEHCYAIKAATLFNGTTYSVHRTSGAIYELDVNTYMDDSVAIYWRVVTVLVDGGTTRRKLYKYGEVVGDKVSGTMYISHTGDDYVTYSTARTVSLSAVRPILYQLGTDRRRAYMFLVTDNIPLRLVAFELNVEGAELEGDPQLSGGSN